MWEAVLDGTGTESYTKMVGNNVKEYGLSIIWFFDTIIFIDYNTLAGNTKETELFGFAEQLKMYGFLYEYYYTTNVKWEISCVVH